MDRYYCVHIEPIASWSVIFIEHSVKGRPCAGPAPFAKAKFVLGRSLYLLNRLDALFPKARHPPLSLLLVCRAEGVTSRVRSRNNWPKLIVLTLFVLMILRLPVRTDLGH